MTAANESLDRRQQIHSRVDQLRASVRGRAREPRPASVPFGATEIPIEPWEWDALVAWSTHPAGGERSWQTLLAEGITLQAKTFDDLDLVAGCAGGDDEERGAAYTELDTDALMAFKLLREVQRTIEQMIVKGRIDQAKKLTQFRRRLNDTTAAIGRLIGETALKEFEDVADAAPSEAAAAFDPPARDPAGTARPGAPAPDELRPLTDEERLRSLVELEDELHRRDATTSHATPLWEQGGDGTEAYSVDQPKPRTSKRIALLAILGVLGVGWMLNMLRSTGKEIRPIPAFALADFAQMRGVTDVVARPPSLYVTVDTETWNRMGVYDRQQLLQEIGAKIEGAGYFGAQVTDTHGKTVARWLKGTGVRLTEATRQAS